MASSTNRKTKQSKQTKAEWKKYEALAGKFFTDDGFEILERNYQAGRKEIDLIVKRDNLIVFVEVKSSLGKKFGHPALRVDQAKQRNLVDGANHYLQSHRWENCDLRFDVVTFLAGQLEHFPDAFSAE